MNIAHPKLQKLCVDTLLQREFNREFPDRVISEYILSIGAFGSCVSLIRDTDGIWTAVVPVDDCTVYFLGDDVNWFEKIYQTKYGGKL